MADGNWWIIDFWAHQMLAQTFEMYNVKIEYIACNAALIIMGLFQRQTVHIWKMPLRVQVRVLDFLY